MSNAAYESESVVEGLDYYPYGGIRIDTTTNYGGVRNKYAGTVNDTLSGLNYMQARYQNSSRGQFISEDPVFWEVGQSDTGRAILKDPQVLNSYSYAANNPITGKDADGRLVELVSRPIGDWNGVPVSQLGAHAFVYVSPDSPGTIGNISGVNTSKAFALSGIPTSYVGGSLMKTANDPVDTMYGSCGTTLCPGSSRVTVAPPAGMTSAQFDAAVVSSYNNLPSNLGSYDFLSAPRAAGWPNSNNAATAILTGARVSQSQIYQYRSTLQNANNRWTPGLGVPAGAPTYSQQIQQTLGQISATLRSISSLLSAYAAGK